MTLQQTIQSLLRLNLSKTQLYRLYCRLDSMMREGMGYQPFGYDWPTLRITRPGLYVAMKAVIHCHERKAL